MAGRVKQISLDIALGESEKESVLQQVKDFLKDKGYNVIGTDQHDVTNLYDGYDTSDAVVCKVIGSDNDGGKKTRKAHEEDNSLSAWSDIIIKPGTKV